MNEISAVVSFLDQLADWEHQCTLVAAVYIPDFVLQLFCLQAARQTSGMEYLAMRPLVFILCTLHSLVPRLPCSRMQTL